MPPRLVAAARATTECSQSAVSNERRWACTIRHTGAAALRAVVLARLAAVLLGVGAVGVVLVQPRDDLVGVARDRRAVVEQQRRDLVGADLAAHLLAVGALGRDRHGGERHAEL